MAYHELDSCEEEYLDSCPQCGEGYMVLLTATGISAANAVLKLKKTIMAH